MQEKKLSTHFVRVSRCYLRLGKLPRIAGLARRVGKCGFLLFPPRRVYALTPVLPQGLTGEVLTCNQGDDFTHRAATAVASAARVTGYDFR